MIELGNYAKARVWAGGDLPALAGSASLTQEVQGGAAAPLAQMQVTLEAFVPRGGYAEYGLLGVRFEPHADTVVRVEVPYTGHSGSRWRSSLADVTDKVFFGLPEEFAPAILEEAVALVAHRFPPGNLRVVEAAHGLVGSNIRTFRMLTRCVLSLLQDDHDDDAPSLTALLNANLVKGGF